MRTDHPLRRLGRLAALAFALMILGIVGSVTGAEAQADQEADQGVEAGTEEYTVRTLPPTPGVMFSFDGEIRTTNSEGNVVFNIKRGGQVFERLIVETPTVSLGSATRAKFTRWRSLRATGVIAQFNYEYQVEFDLKDVLGNPVAVERIDEVKLKSSIGEVISITPTDRPWLLGLRIVPGRDTLDEKPVFWTVQDATDSGLGVVKRSGTKFFPSEEQYVEVEMLYFGARFRIVDAFFGSSTGDTLEIEAPDGTVSLEPIVDGMVELDQVARGEYRMTILGPGPRLTRPVSITRNQDVDLKLYTWLDIGVVGGFGLFFATAPLLIGFRHRRQSRRRPSGDSAAGMSNAGTIPSLTTANPASEDRGLEECVEGQHENALNTHKHDEPAEMLNGVHDDQTWLTGYPAMSPDGARRHEDSSEVK